LAKAGVAAEARVGDEDLVQAVEDQLQSFPATDVILVLAGPDEAEAAAEASAELESRLQARFSRVVVGEG
jgi:NAD/NADP transhydrogenase beta subunit